jgi:hypothetical protein
MRFDRLLFSLLTFAPLQLHAQSQVDQQQIELSVARYLVSTPAPVPEWFLRSPLYRSLGLDTLKAGGVQADLWSGRRFVLEPRLLAEESSPELSASHTPDHLRELASALGIQDVLDDSAACSDWASTCRYVGYDGFVQFGKALFGGDTAAIVVRVGGMPRGRAGAVGGAGQLTGNSANCRILRAGWRTVSCHWLSVR